MSSEEERIRELLLTLRRDFKISKDVENALSEIGSGVVPHLLAAFKVDDYAFRVRIIETLGKLGEIGQPGLVELLDCPDIKMKITILRTIRKIGKITSPVKNSVIEKMGEIVEWDHFEYTKVHELADQIDDLFQYKYHLVKTLHETYQMTNNIERIEEIAFITAHIFLRKIENREVKDSLKYLYLKLKENKAIEILELEEIYREMFRLDPRLKVIISTYIKRKAKDISQQILEKLLTIIGEQLPRGIIYKYCERKFYTLNYDSANVENYANFSFYFGMVYLFEEKQLETITKTEDYEEIKKIISNIKEEWDEEFEDIYLGDITGKSDSNESFKVGITQLDLSVKQLTTVNLKPLIYCFNLEFINLSENQLTVIDLTPLEKCSQLEFLDLTNNQITTLDLSPLQRCSELQWLMLTNNQLSKINLQPLQNNSKLIELKIGNNLLTSLDLTPLKKCLQLEELDLTTNQLTSIDVTPLAECKQLEYLGIDDSTELLWQQDVLPRVEDLPLGLQEHYARLSVAK